MTDTLDAIAREKFAHTLSRMLLRRERTGAVTERGQRLVKAERDALQAAITALSNQGEGVVVAWLESEPGTEIAELRNADHPLHYYRSCIVHIGQREPAKKQPENSLFPLYDGPAEADRRDAEPVVGDYVLATKYSDGDPADRWALGFYAGPRGKYHFVNDNDGKSIHAGGYRRVGKVSKETGAWLLQNAATLERTSPGLNLWHLAAAIAATQEQT